jgi:hypothetical protein
MSTVCGSSRSLDYAGRFDESSLTWSKDTPRSPTDIDKLASDTELALEAAIALLLEIDMQLSARLG